MLGKVRNGNCRDVSAGIAFPVVGWRDDTYIPKSNFNVFCFTILLVLHNNKKNSMQISNKIKHSLRSSNILFAFVPNVFVT